jgi:hypothetical protein
VVGWQSAGNDRAVAAVQQQNRVAAPSAQPTVQPTGSVKYYVVRGSYNGQKEFLFEIAQRFLGDGNRYMEIFNLNKGRPQPGGGSLQDATSVLPGWILLLPNNAQGSGVQFGPLPKVVASATPTTPQNGSSLAPPASQSSASNGSSAVLWVVVGIAVVVIAAAIVALVLRRRRKEPAAQNAAPTTPADRSSAAWTIDRALKALTTACDGEEIAFPGVYLVTVDAASVRVTVSRPSVRAPAGWTASSDGRTWSAQLAALQASDVRDTGGHSFAGLVMLGASGDGQVLLDLDQAAGPISVNGPKGAVDEIVEAWITELTTNPWSGTVRVARINGRNEPNLEIVENLLADLDAGERALIVFDEPPSRSQTAALRASFTSATTAWILIKGNAPVATWKFTANGGVLSSGFLPDIQYGASPGTPGFRRHFRGGPPAAQPGHPARDSDHPKVPDRKPSRAQLTVMGIALLVVAVGASFWGLHASQTPTRTLQTAQSLPKSPPTSQSLSANPVKTPSHKPAKPATHHSSSVPQGTPAQPPANQGVALAPSLPQSTAPNSAPSRAQAPSAPHSTAPKSAPFQISGTVSCISGNTVEGVWVAAGKGSGYSPWTGQGNGASASFIYTLPLHESYSLHVGCGGTTSTWKVATYSVTVSGAVNNFVCDDVSGQPSYGSCHN